MKGDTALVHKLKVRDKTGRVIAEKEVASYAALLDLAHRERLKLVKTKLLQAPYDENGMTAIVHATVETTRGTFTGIGDANPQNVEARIAPHVIRMAETRAIARALRNAVNIGVVAAEELGQDAGEFTFAPGVALAPPANDNGGPTVEPAAQPGNSPAAGSTAPDEPRRPQAWSPSAVPSSRSDRASDQQRRFLFRLLYERNVTGEAARDLIHRELGVESVQDASRAAVSALIDKIKQNGHAAEGA